MKRSWAIATSIFISIISLWVSFLVFHIFCRDVTFALDWRLLWASFFSILIFGMGFVICMGLIQFSD